MLRCDDCGKGVIEVLKWSDWTWLINYFEMQYLEGNITEATYKAAWDHLMRFKTFAMEKEPE